METCLQPLVSLAPRRKLLARTSRPFFDHPSSLVRLQDIAVAHGDPREVLLAI
ncbi:MAG: hypothetical protein RMJ98_01825 [Myxococcales bacterium]|nr:hypothetical protein [Myxococcales bacterium]